MKQPFSIICLVLGLMLGSCGSREEYGGIKTIDKKTAVNLNKTLTNEMSSREELAGMDRMVESYMRQWELHGLTLSIMRNDSLLFSKGYGESDTDKAMTPGTIMRVASVSKLITAVGIMKMCEQGKLSFSSKVFGDDGILSSYTGFIKDKRYFEITVEDLLRHEGGFSTRGGDPMFSTRGIMIKYGLTTPPDNRKLTELMVGRRLKFYPGTSQDYSNFGYMLLSMIIEEVSGEPYEKWMQKNVLIPAGCRDMHIATNSYRTRRENETRYYVPSNEPEIEEYNNSGRMVVRCYGGNDITALSGAGAWVTSTAELTRLVASIDGRDGVPDILSEESIRTMTRWFDDNTFSIGWNDTKPDVGWTRTGTLSGTSALIKYFPDGECWTLVTNTSTWKGSRFTRYTSGLFTKLKPAYSDKLPKQNLFYKD